MSYIQDIQEIRENGTLVKVKVTVEADFLEKKKFIDFSPEQFKSKKDIEEKVEKYIKRIKDSKDSLD